MTHGDDVDKATLKDGTTLGVGRGDKIINITKVTSTDNGGGNPSGGGNVRGGGRGVLIAKGITYFLASL